MLKLLPNQINVINSGSESDINNDRQTEKTRKMWMFSRPTEWSMIWI